MASTAGRANEPNDFWCGINKLGQLDGRMEYKKRGGTIQQQHTCLELNRTLTRAIDFSAGETVKLDDRLIGVQYLLGEIFTL